MTLTTLQQRLGWAFLVVFLFGLGRWVAWRGVAITELEAPMATLMEMQTTAADDTYEGRLRMISADQFLGQWQELVAIPESERDLAWPARCGALWERWAEVYLVAALAALPAAPPLPPPPPARDSKAFLETARASFVEAPDSILTPPEWVSDLPRHAVFASWARRDLAAALAKAEGLPREERVAALRGVMETLAVIEPEKFLAEAVRLGPVYTEYDRFRAFATVAKTKPLLAAEYAEEVATGQHANWDPRGNSNVWAGSNHNIEVWQIIMRTWADVNPRAAAAYLEKVSSESGASSCRHLVLVKLAKVDPALAAEFLVSERWGKYGADIQNKIRNLISADGVGLRLIAAMLPHLPDLRDRENVVREVAEHAGGSRLEYAEVLNFYHTLPSDLPSAQKFLKQLLPRWRKEDPTGAIATIQAITPAQIKKEMLAEFVSGGHPDGGGALSISELRERLTYVPADLVDELKAGAVEKLNFRESAAAQIREFVGELPTGKFMERGLTHFYERWLYFDQDFPSIAGALASEPRNLVAPWVFDSLTRTWANENSLAASEWVRALPNGNDRDAAIRGLVQVLAEPDPESAAIWLQAIQDRDTAKRAIEDAEKYLTSAGKQRFHQARESQISKPP